MVLLALCVTAPAAAQNAAPLEGRWALDRGLSQFPREIGFGATWFAPGDTTRDTGTRKAPARAIPFDGRQSEEESRRLLRLTDAVRSPSARLTIADTPAAVTITDERGQVVTVHPDGREELLQVEGVPVATVARREAGRLIVTYKVQSGRELRYAYGRAPGTSQLIVEVQFVEKGAGDQVRRVYTPAPPDEATPPPAVAGAAPVRPSAGDGPPPLLRRPPDVSQASPAASPASSPAPRPAQPFSQAPDAELRGLRAFGVVVEDVGPQAVSCGLNQRGIETALAARLTDAGFTVKRNDDEETYLYVNIVSTSPSAGLCVSRYDATIYTHAMATLPYQPAPVLVQVSLLHKGGIAGGAPAAHAAGVMRGLQEYVDQFVGQIRAAGR